MSKVKEANLWNWLSGARSTFKQQLHMVRVENIVESGYPDVEGFLYPNKAFWIELKALEYPSSFVADVKHNVTQEQISWLYNRAAVGGFSWVLFQFGEGSNRLRLMMPGIDVPKLQQKLSLNDLMQQSRVVSNLSPSEVIRVAANIHSSYGKRR